MYVCVCMYVSTMLSTAPTSWKWICRSTYAHSAAKEETGVCLSSSIHDPCIQYVRPYVCKSHAPTHVRMHVRISAMTHLVDPNAMRGRLGLGQGREDLQAGPLDRLRQALGPHDHLTDRREVPQWVVVLIIMRTLLLLLLMVVVAVVGMLPLLAMLVRVLVVRGRVAVVVCVVVVCVRVGPHRHLLVVVHRHHVHVQRRDGALIRREGTGVRIDWVCAVLG
jgi:hypothetical protein